MVLWKEVLNYIKENCASLKDVFYACQKYFAQNVFSIETKGGKTVKKTFGEMRAEALKICLNLKNEGVKFGDVVGIAMPNRSEWVAAFWGVLMSGAVPILVNITFLNSQTERIFKEVGVKFCISDGNYTYSDVKMLNVSDFCSETAAQYTIEDWNDYFIVTTSGSTGLGKVFRYDGRAVCAQIGCSERIIKENPTILNDKNYDIRLLALLPFYHIFGLITLVVWFGTLGRTLVFAEGMSPEDIKNACIKYKVTHLFAVPMVWASLENSVKTVAEAQGRKDTLKKICKVSEEIQKGLPHTGGKLVRKTVLRGILSNILGMDLCFCISGGAAIGSETLHFINSLGYPLYNGYGMTEAGIVSVETSLNYCNRLYTFCGRPLTGVEYSVSESGTLLLKGDVLYNAEWKNGAFVLRDKNEWFDTKDAVSVEKGRLFVRGRQDDIIIGLNGENVYPDEIENLLAEKGINDVCVFGIKSSLSDEIICVKCCKHGETEAEKADIIRAVNTLPTQYKPKRVICTEKELPEVKGGINRNAVYEEYLAGAYGTLSSKRADAGIGDPVTLFVKRIFANALNVPLAEIRADTDFFLDAGGNSLQFFSVLHDVNEKYACNLGFTEDSWEPNPNSIASFINKRQNPQTEENK